jgi:hypothetical protein
VQIPCVHMIHSNIRGNASWYIIYTVLMYQRMYQCISRESRVGIQFLNKSADWTVDNIPGGVTFWFSRSSYRWWWWCTGIIYRHRGSRYLHRRLRWWLHKYIGDLWDLGTWSYVRGGYHWHAWGLRVGWRLGILHTLRVLEHTTTRLAINNICIN